MGKGVCQASRINVTSLRVSMDNPILDPCILARTRIEKRTVKLKVSYGHSLYHDDYLMVNVYKGSSPSVRKLSLHVHGNLAEKKNSTALQLTIKQIIKQNIKY